MLNTVSRDFLERNKITKIYLKAEIKYIKLCSIPN